MNPLPPLSLQPELCRARQARVARALSVLDADGAILVLPEHVHYLTGFRPHPLMTALVRLDAGGRCLLVAPNETPADSAGAVDEVRTFAAQWHATLRQEQLSAAAEVLRDALTDGPRARRLAIELSSGASSVARAVAGDDTVELVDLEPELWRLRRNKDPDELAMMRRAIACTEAMYARAREIITPGITELEVFNALHAAAVEVAGEPLTALGNDYRANASGGPPRPRAAQQGELYILDLGPAYRGYYADNCRTLTVGASPTDAQQEAWECIVATLQMVENTVKPGVGCHAVFEKAQEMLDEYRPGAFCHHLGHGVGLYPHEAPHLNPHWDDVFEAGDVFTAEPGLYGDELAAGIRLEQNYRVSARGVDLLTEFPLDM